ncbi:MAG: hypothetical protein JWO38_6996 [Gemmataceae bacterium]|nr:hypothetical protein [Gemmataceae bacterium]
MPTNSITSTVREILTSDPSLSADEVIKRAKARGLDAPVPSIRNVVHNIRSDIKKKKKAKAAPAAAREIPKPKPPAAAPKSSAATPKPSTATPLVPNLADLLANVALVNRVVGLCGGPENARQAAEAVRTSGGVDAFLQHVDLIAGIRGPTTA